MRYLRMLTNAIAGGVLAAAYLTVLLLQLNPHVPLESATSMRWFATFVEFYGLYLGVGWYLAILARDAIASEPLRPAWVSVRLVAWIGALTAVGAAAVTWGNLNGFRGVLGAQAAERMRQGAMATTVSAGALVLIALVRYSFGRRGSRAAAGLLVVGLIFSVVVPLELRGPGDLPVPPARRRLAPVPLSTPPPRVHLLLIDGASFGLIRERVAAGQLPNFGRLLDRGASIYLATLKPTQVEPVWTAAATGKYPAKTGVRSNSIYRVGSDDADPIDLLPDFCFSIALADQGFIHFDPRTRASVGARPLWDILNDYGIASGITNWPLTYPARAPRGYMLSDLFDDGASSPLRTIDPRAGDPTTAAFIARDVFDAWIARPWQDVLPGTAPNEPQPDGLQSARWDRAYIESADQIDQEFVTRLTAIRLEGLEAFGHYDLREAQPELFGESSRYASRRSVLDRYYAYVDEQIGREVAALKGDDLLLVVSGFGMENESLTKRLLARVLGRPQLSGTHERAPDGFLLAYGANVTPGLDPRGSIVDLAPTVLYYMGLPVGRDMDGFARTDLFSRRFTIDHPVSYVATHEQ